MPVENKIVNLPEPPSTDYDGLYTFRFRQEWNTLKTLSGMTDREMSDRLGLSFNTTKKWWTKAGATRISHPPQAVIMQLFEIGQEYATAKNTRPFDPYYLITGERETALEKHLKGIIDSPTNNHRPA